MSSLAVADSASLDAIFASAAANEYDPEMLTKVKDDWIAKQLTVRRDEFTNNVPLRYVGGLYSALPWRRNPPARRKTLLLGDSNIISIGLSTD